MAKQIGASGAPQELSVYLSSCPFLVGLIEKKRDHRGEEQ